LQYRITPFHLVTPLLLLWAGSLSAQPADQDPAIDPQGDPQSSPVATSPVSTNAVPSPPALYVPLSLKQKYLYSLNEMASPSRWFGYAARAALDESRHSPHAWGQGADSFGVRMADKFGRSFVRENIAASIRALDHEDPRYFPLGAGTKWERVKYALTRTVVTRRDDGGWGPAFGRIAADYATPFIAQTWRPEKFSVSRGLRGGSIAIGMDFGSNLWKEFWPDLRKRSWMKRFPRSSRTSSVTNPTE
jgi:hypothetical protein